MSDERAAVLITGADGYLGRRIARRLRDAGMPLLLWVRATSGAELERKRAALDAELSEPRRDGMDTDSAGTGPCGAASAAIRFASGDLAATEPFDGIDPDSVRLIVHTAAVTRFNVDEETARRVNVDGTAKLLRFAARCRRLERFEYLSTIYASGLREGPVREEPLPISRFANHYESSKWAAEQLVQESSLPWRILRVATVIADREDGTVTQYNAVHNTLQLLYYGLISTLPGLPETPLYFVTGDFAADAAAALLAHPSKETFFHLAHRREQSLTLEALVAIVFEVFEADAGFRKRRVPRPLYVDETAFEMLHQAVSTFTGGVVGQAMSSVAPFARELFVHKDVENGHMIEALGRDPAPDPAALVRRACASLVRSRWGRPASSSAAETGVASATGSEEGS
jgi:nucleoside-diphosphate-sugar epimerase